MACIFSRSARAAALSFSAFLRSFRALAARSSSSSRSLGGRGGSLEHMPRCLRGTDLPPRMRRPSSVFCDIRLLCRLALLRWLKSTVMALQGVGGGRAAVSEIGAEEGAQEGSPARDSSERTRAFVSRETLGVRRTARDRRARSCGRHGRTLSRTCRLSPAAKRARAGLAGGRRENRRPSRFSRIARRRRLGGAESSELGAPGRGRHVRGHALEVASAGTGDAVSPPLVALLARAALLSRRRPAPALPRVPPVQIPPALASPTAPPRLRDGERRAANPLVRRSRPPRRRPRAHPPRHRRRRFRARVFPHPAPNPRAIHVRARLPRPRANLDPNRRTRVGRRRRVRRPRRRARRRGGPHRARTRPRASTEPTRAPPRRRARRRGVPSRRRRARRGGPRSRRASPSRNRRRRPSRRSRRSRPSASRRRRVRG